jgi:molybdopterin/thiamine biosynthesis adenylyltransferase/rhodanese-related sulfurtransferase
MPFPPLVAPVARLDSGEALRTSRHAALAGFGEIGQRRLAAAHVAVVGAGGIGSPVVLALAAAGVGTLTVIDDDVVEASNLQRQIMHRRRDIGNAKTSSAARVAADLSTTVVHCVNERITADNAGRLLSGADVVIDGTDTFATREIVALACEASGVPLVWGVVQEFHAQATVFWSSPPEGSPAVVLRDLYPPESVGDVPSCSEVGVLGALCMQVGAVLATEAIKLITGTGEPLLGRLLLIDALRGRTDEVPLRASQAPAAPAQPVAVAPAHVSPADALRAQSLGATLVDVREKFETDAGVIAGSVLMPLDTLLADPARAGSGPFVVVCKGGMRAERAARALLATGASASVLAGGIDAWSAASRATVPA